MFVCVNVPAVFGVETELQITQDLIVTVLAGAKIP